MKEPLVRCFVPLPDQEPNSNPRRRGMMRLQGPQQVKQFRHNEGPQSEAALTEAGCSDFEDSPLRFCRNQPCQLKLSAAMELSKLFLFEVPLCDQV